MFVPLGLKAFYGKKTQLKNEIRKRQHENYVQSEEKREVGNGFCVRLRNLSRILVIQTGVRRSVPNALRGLVATRWLCRMTLLSSKHSKQLTDVLMEWSISLMILHAVFCCSKEPSCSAPLLAQTRKLTHHALLKTVPYSSCHRRTR